MKISYRTHSTRNAKLVPFSFTSKMFFFFFLWNCYHLCHKCPWGLGQKLYLSSLLMYQEAGFFPVKNLRFLIHQNIRMPSAHYGESPINRPIPCYIMVILYKSFINLIFDGGGWWYFHDMKILNKWSPLCPWWTVKK